MLASDRIQSRSYTFDPRPNYPLLATAKRYWIDGPDARDPNAYTLVFAHAIGFSKEHWEPSIEHLYDFFAGSDDSNTKIRIREVWSIDAPNHGEAAILNEEALQWGYQPICMSSICS